MEKLDSSLLDLLLLYMGQYNRGCNTIRVLHVPERLFSVLLRERNFKNSTKDTECEVEKFCLFINLYLLFDTAVYKAG